MPTQSPPGWSNEDMHQKGLTVLKGLDEVYPRRQHERPYRHNIRQSTPRAYCSPETCWLYHCVLWMLEWAHSCNPGTSQIDCVGQSWDSIMLYHRPSSSWTSLAISAPRFSDTERITPDVEQTTRRMRGGRNERLTWTSYHTTWARLQHKLPTAI